MSHAQGTFDVSLTPAPAADTASTVGRLTISKQYHGDLDATAVGEMLTAMTTISDSAGYVAIEKVTGSLAGRAGSFMLQHTGTMNRGQPQLTITVVPDSGTEGLTGLTGHLSIVNQAGAHSYQFEYQLP